MEEPPKKAQCLTAFDCRGKTRFGSGSAFLTPRRACQELHNSFLTFELLARKWHAVRLISKVEYTTVGYTEVTSATPRICKRQVADIHCSCHNLKQKDYVYLPLKRHTHPRGSEQN